MADVTYRTGYGTSAYGAAAYGVDVEVKAAASTVVTVSATDAVVTRVQFGAADFAFASGFAANAIGKWEPEAGTAETWTPVDPASEIWQDVANAAED